MKILLTSFILVFSINCVFSQRETSHWYFGSDNHLYFDTNSVQVLAPLGISTVEAASSISDPNGNLLLYTNGEWVDNGAVVWVQNGFAFNGDKSTTQCLIVKQPLSDSLYYIFYADNFGGPGGANYAIVDITANAGYGAVTSKNNLLFPASSEKFTAVKHQNDTDIWVMTRSMNPVSFKAYLLSRNGLNLNPVISYDGTIETSGVGQMKFSHNGSLLALAIADMHVYELLDFNKDHGTLTNPRLSVVFPDNYNYGVEFSPNDSILYASYFWHMIIKYDLSSAGNPLLNYSVLDSSLCEFGSLQLAIDGNIYVAREGGNLVHGLGKIQYPNNWIYSNYVDTGVVLTYQNPYSLPNFEQSLLKNVRNNIPSFLINLEPKSGFNIFPNPCWKELNIKSQFEFSSITIVDVFGMEVFRKSFNPVYSIKISITDVPAGFFLLSISTKNGYSTKKLLVN